MSVPVALSSVRWPASGAPVLSQMSYFAVAGLQAVQVRAVGHHAAVGQQHRVHRNQRPRCRPATTCRRRSQRAGSGSAARTRRSSCASRCRWRRRRTVGRSAARIGLRCCRHRRRRPTAPQPAARPHHGKHERVVPWHPPPDRVGPFLAMRASKCCASAVLRESGERGGGFLPTTYATYGGECLPRIVDRSTDAARHSQHGEVGPRNRAPRSRQVHSELFVVARREKP